MKLLASLFLLATASLTPQLHAQKAAPLVGTWNGTAISHHQQVPIHLKITGKGADLKAALVNGPEESPASTVTLTGDHLLITFNEYAKTLDLTSVDGHSEGTYKGTFGTTKVRYPVTLYYDTPDVAGGPLFPGLEGDWEVAVTSAKGETAWQLKIEKSIPGLQRAVIQRIDGDTGSLFATAADPGFFSHFTAAGPALYRIKPNPDGTLTLSNVLRADLTPPQQQNLIARHPAEARKQNLAPPTDTAQQTTVKDPYARFTFSFPDLNGKLVSNTDPQFDGKVVIVAIGGSWCPNCHDEAPFLVSLYKQFHAQGLEIVNLSFEEEEQMANPTGLHAFIKKYGIPYTVLLAGNTDQLNEKITQFNNLNCWPTAFFLGRDGKVKEVHAGYAGPANPVANKALTQEVTELIQHLIAEPAPTQNAAR